MMYALVMASMIKCLPVLLCLPMGLVILKSWSEKSPTPIIIDCNHREWQGLIQGGE